MGKIGVGIGDEFPIDDGRPAGESASAPGYPNDADYEARREEWRRQREAWREQRRQWRAKWREHRRAFREEMRARYGDRYGYDGPGDGHWHGPFFEPRHLFRLALIIGAIMIAVFVFQHLYLLFGLLVLAGLFAAYHNGFDQFEMMHAASGPRPQSPTPPAPPAPPADAPKV